MSTSDSTDTAAASAGGGSNGAPLLAIRGLTKRFGPVQALTRIDFDVPAGQVTALAGDNGAGKTAPASLLNATATDPSTNIKVPSVYLTPQWVTPANMNATIIKDNFVPAAQLCAGKFAADCKAAGISG